MTPREAFALYLQLGWCAVPVARPALGGPSPGKKPGLGSLTAWRKLWSRADLWHPARTTPEKIADGAGWEYLRLTPETLDLLGDAEHNIGINLGEPSGGLVDVDLDCDEARELAPRFLRDRNGQPWATWVFGRESTPRSHWIFVAPGAVTTKLSDLKPDGSRGGDTICELRGTARRAVDTGIGGSQSVFPPSLHASGEWVEWDLESMGDGRGVLRVDARELRAAVHQLGAAVLVMRHAGREAALAWLGGAGKVPCPKLPEPVEALAREWWGLPPKGAKPKTQRPAPRVGSSWMEALRGHDVATVATAFGIEVVERGGRPAGLRPCPGCADTQRGRKGDKRPPAEITSNGHGWLCWRCGSERGDAGRGDVVALAALVATGKRKDLTKDEWRKVRVECEARGLLGVPR